MNRVIKFRVFDGTGMYFGGFSIHATGKFIDESWYHEEGQEYPVMQFTGLRDKNGAEMYESDIIEDADSGSLWVVKFDDRGSFVASFAGDMDLSVMLDDYNFKVIGNLYKNPELLK